METQILDYFIFAFTHDVYIIGLSIAYNGGVRSPARPEPAPVSQALPVAQPA